MTDVKIERIAEGVTLYLGDCREILPTIGKVDAVVTDQPYGTGWVRGGKRVGEFAAGGEHPAWDVWDTGWIKLCQAETIAAFCPSSRLRDLFNAFGGGNLRTYVKSNPRPSLGNSDAPSLEPIVVYPKVRFGGMQHFICYNGDNQYHPTQKPLQLMQWLIQGVSAAGETVADPFMGSGSTGVAAVNLGRKFVGIEIDPKYFDIACKRIDEEVRTPKFVFEEKPARQLAWDEMWAEPFSESKDSP